MELTSVSWNSPNKCPNVLYWSSVNLDDPRGSQPASSCCEVARTDVLSGWEARSLALFFCHWRWHSSQLVCVSVLYVKEEIICLLQGCKLPYFSQTFVSGNVDYVVSSLCLAGWRNYRLWLTVGFFVLAHHCPAWERWRETWQHRSRDERQGLKKRRRGDKLTERGWRGREEEEEEAGVRDKKLGCVPGSIPPLPSRSFWAATFSHLCNVINEKAFTRDGGLDSGFRLWPTAADAAKSSRILLELIGCHFKVQGTRHVSHCILTHATAQN